MSLPPFRSDIAADVWPVASRRADVIHMTPSSPSTTVILAQSAAGIDHYPRVPQSLAARGLESLLIRPGVGAVRVERPTTAAVVVADTETSQSRYLLTQARANAIPTILLMDGILEWRNTFCNPAVGAHFLSPAPVDAVACAGSVDAALLTAWGNTAAIATGLPRLWLPETERHAMTESQGDVILIATARHPWFSSAQRDRLIASLRHLKAAVESNGLKARWRIAREAAEAIGVPHDADDSLTDALRSARAVVTTPSTLLIEAMQSGRPTCLLNPFGTPCWQQAVWSTAGRSPREWRSVLDTLMHADCAALHRQWHIVQRLHESAADPAERLAQLIERQIATPTRPRPSAVRAATPPARAALLPWGPPIRPRAISCVVCDGSSLGGVTTWSMRLAREFARRPDLGYDVRTLLIGTHAEACECASLVESESDRELVSSLIVDPTMDAALFLDDLRRTLAATQSSIILPNYADFCYAVAMQLRADGVRTVSVAHSDDWYYRHLTSVYHDWDAAVGVSRTCARWLTGGRRSADRDPRPVHQITYGVPIADTQPSRHAARDRGRISLAYIGRMVNYQKRLDHFVPLVRCLCKFHVPFHLHMVGDGSDADGCREAMKSILPPDEESQSVTWHGRRTPGWTLRFLREHVDVSILLSDFEGTSITMLEAMGQGVAPAVTDVDSGVSEWVQDDHNGIVVQVGRPDEMAHRIAKLTRREIDRLGQAAWETVRQRRAGVEAMADRYRAVFDEVMSQPVVRPVPNPALGWCLTDTWRWTKTWADDPARGRECIERQLHEAGCRQILNGYPTDATSVPDASQPCTALVDAARQHEIPSQETRDTWSKRGVETILLPTLLTGPAANTLAEQSARMRQALDRARAGGATRIAIYGTGKHTQRLRDLLTNEPDIVGFIDDHPRDGDLYWDRPVAPIREIRDRVRPDAVVISSDAWERRLWRKCAPLRRDGIAVYALYGAEQALEQQRRRVVVSTVYCDPTPVGGVTTWSLRLTEALAALPELGCDCHTVLICPAALAGQVRAFADTHLMTRQPNLRPFVHVLPIDLETSDHIDLLDAVRTAVESLAPDVILPNYTDLTCAVATQIRQTGRSRTVAIAHADDPYYQKLLKTYDRWDGVVAVSASCLEWANRLTADSAVPTRQIVYGVPASSAPRSVTAPDKPLQLAYVGRMVQHQKRVFEFVELVKRLEALGTNYRLHMVGDGPDLESCRALMNSADRVIWHGHQSSAWVQQFWSMVDVAVLLSEFEGTSITMLEAMAHGVVPAVTEVRSGVREWVDDGVHGIMVPNDQSPAAAMALRLHALSLDRTQLADMGSNAWQRIKDRQLTVGHMAAQYAALFEAVLTDYKAETVSPTDTSLRLTDRTRWTRPTTPNPGQVNSRIRAWLTEAGYERILDLEPGQLPDSLDVNDPNNQTAVIVHTQGDGDGDDDWFASVERAAHRWRHERGVGVVFSPHLFERPELEPHGTMRRALRRAVADGRQRIVVYGVGKHTRQLLSVVTGGARFPIIGFMDDNPPPDLLANGLAGLPVVRADNVFNTLRPDCIILSSDAWERQMWDRCRKLKSDRSDDEVIVVALHSEYSEAGEKEIRPLIPHHHAAAFPT